MSALSYSPTSLLVGKYYSSASRPLDGIIQEALHAPDLFYVGAEAYRVRVRPTYKGQGHAIPEDFWATVTVCEI